MLFVSSFSRLYDRDRGEYVAAQWFIQRGDSFAAEWCVCVWARLVVAHTGFLLGVHKDSYTYNIGIPGGNLLRAPLADYICTWILGDILCAAINGGYVQHLLTHVYSSKLCTIFQRTSLRIFVRYSARLVKKWKKNVEKKYWPYFIWLCESRLSFFYGCIIVLDGKGGVAPPPLQLPLRPSSCLFNCPGTSWPSWDDF